MNLKLFLFRAIRYRIFLRSILLIFMPLLIGYFLIFLILINLYGRFHKNKKSPRLIFGPDSIINNKYWADAMKRFGYTSHSCVYPGDSFIIKSTDYDFTTLTISKINRVLLSSIIKTLFGEKVVRFYGPYFTAMKVLATYDIFHFSFNGGFLSKTIFKNYEAQILRFLNKKCIIIPFGSDAYDYKFIKDPILQMGLLKSQNKHLYRSKEISKSVEYWSNHADIIIPGFMLDGMKRWDVLAASPLAFINPEVLNHEKFYSNHDGQNNEVTIVHAPNHRGFKGTEFIIDAIQELKSEGVKINLVLLEGVNNKKVLEILSKDADILVEQLIFTGYALNGIEGMATGTAVISNINNQIYADILMAYSNLSECPIKSANVKTIKGQLKELVTKPELRRALGKAGKQYIKKYHSYEGMNYLFSNIYKKIWYGEDIELLDLYHPLKSDYVKNTPIISHE